VSFFAHFGRAGIADGTVGQDLGLQLGQIADELDHLTEQNPPMKAIRARFSSARLAGTWVTDSEFDSEVE
jgi:hypothetical protein